MPPALSEDDVSSDEQIPPQNEGKQSGAKSASKSKLDSKPSQERSDGGESEDSGEGEDEYVVEKILSHRFVQGELQFEVKWQGYENPKDRTWEPENNMDGAVDVMKEYFEELGGRPEPKGGQKRKGRQSGAKSETKAPTASAKRAKQEKEWSPPPGSWEDEISHIDTVEESIVPKSGERRRFAYLVWNNQRKTQHPLKHVYKKCPQKMLLYYESHLVFTPNKDLEDLDDGDDDGNSIMMGDAF